MVDVVSAAVLAVVLVVVPVFGAHMHRTEARLRRVEEQLRLLRQMSARERDSSPRTQGGSSPRTQGDEACDAEGGMRPHYEGHPG